jgi:hypothetical protein
MTLMPPATLPSEFRHAMLTLHAAVMRPEVHALRRRVDDLLDDAHPSHWAIFTTFSAVLADCVANAPPDIREDLIGVVNDVLERRTD